jgi:hypothetical protein
MGHRQGIYTRSGSIAVLCMYLGQLAKLRDALTATKINVLLDPRDEAELRDQEEDATGNANERNLQPEIAEVQITDTVREQSAKVTKSLTKSFEDSTANR